MQDDPEPPNRKGPSRVKRPPPWINPTDEQGNPIDPLLLEAAAKIWERLLAYRASELGDESLAIQLIEQAVHSASRCRHGQAVRDWVPYLFRTFIRLMNAELEKRKLFISLDEKVLYERADGHEEPDVGEVVEREVAISKLDPRLLKMVMATRWGATKQELAERMHVKVNTLNQQICRTRKENKKSLDCNSTKAPLSRSDGEANLGPTEPAGPHSSSGGKRAA